MNTGEVMDLFKDYIDEPDENYVSDGDLARYLSIAYNEFRSLIRQLTPNAYQQRTTLTFTAQSEYDLNSDTSSEPVTVLGSTPSVGHNMLTLIAVADTPGAPSDMVPTGFWKGVVNPRSMWMTDRRMYIWVGSILRLSYSHTGLVTIYYDASVAVTWTNPTDFIDDFVDWHDLIPLLGWKQYAIRDNASNPLLLDQLMSRKQDLTNTAMSRQAEGAQYVNEVWDSYEVQ